MALTFSIIFLFNLSLSARIVFRANLLPFFKASSSCSPSRFDFTIALNKANTPLVAILRKLRSFVIRSPLNATLQSTSRPLVLILATFLRLRTLDLRSSSSSLSLPAFTFVVLRFAKIGRAVVPVLLTLCPTIFEITSARPSRSISPFPPSLPSL